MHREHIDLTGRALIPDTIIDENTNNNNNNSGMLSPNSKTRASISQGSPRSPRASSSSSKILESPAQAANKKPKTSLTAMVMNPGASTIHLNYPR